MSKMWNTVVEPINDLAEHEESLDCLCNPYIEDDVLVHNSFDGREYAEEGQKVITIVL